MIKKLIATCMGAMLAVMLVGCASGSQANNEEMSQSASDKPAELAIVGEQAQGNTEIQATNNMKQAITSIALRAADAKSFTANLVKSGTTIAANEQFLLCFKPTGADVAYEMAITLADGSQYVLTNLQLTNYKSMNLAVQNGMASTTYVTLSDQTGTTPQVAAVASATSSQSSSSSSSQSTSSQSTSSQSSSSQSSSSSKSSSSSQSSSSVDPELQLTPEQQKMSDFIDSEDYHGDAGPVDPDEANSNEYMGAANPDNFDWDAYYKEHPEGY